MSGPGQIMDSTLNAVGGGGDGQWAATGRSTKNTRKSSYWAGAAQENARRGAGCGRHLGTRAASATASAACWLPNAPESLAASEGSKWGEESRPAKSPNNRSAATYCVSGQEHREAEGPGGKKGKCRFVTVGLVTMAPWRQKHQTFVDPTAHPEGPSEKATCTTNRTGQN